MCRWTYEIIPTLNLRSHIVSFVGLESRADVSIFAYHLLCLKKKNNFRVRMRCFEIVYRSV